MGNLLLAVLFIYVGVVACVLFMATGDDRPLRQAVFGVSTVLAWIVAFLLVVSYVLN
jgi:hypothetical protein